MSKIEELIAELCPDGVAYWNLGDVAELQRGQSITKKDLIDGDIPVIAGGQNPAYFHGKSNREGETVVVAGSGAYAGFVTFWKEPIFVSDAFSVVAKSEVVLPRYVFYLLKNKQNDLHGLKRGSGVPHVYAKDIAGWKIPVPPLEIQNAIVDVLDSFTDLEVRLEAELENELQARRFQHTHYRNYLLTPQETWEQTTLGAIADIFDGPHATPTKTAIGPWYLSISSLRDGHFDLTKSAHFTEEQYPKWTRRVTPCVGDTMFSYETRIGQAAYWDLEEPAALGRRMGILRPKTNALNPRFLTLLYLGPHFQEIIKRKTIKGSTVDRIPIANMASWEVKVPSLDEQDRIIREIDEIDTLMNELKNELPAELIARRKQYEHYRNKLLAFPELANA